MHNKAERKPNLVIITGLSGAGKSIAINALEDLGFYCIDNLPMELVNQVVDFFIRSKDVSTTKFALVMDLRSHHFADDFLPLAKKLHQRLGVRIVFLTCSDEQLAERFATNRRKHPMLSEGGELLAAIRREKVALQPVESISDIVLDTSSSSPHALKRRIENYFGRDTQARQLYVSVTSFGFKHGLLKPSDSIFDVRFLKNPYFDLALRNKSGLEKKVSDYVLSDKRSHQFLNYLLDMHRFLLPHYYQEGKHYFRIGIGCTGGMHRSVAMSEAFALALAKDNLPQIFISVAHRDLDIEQRDLSSGTKDNFGATT